MNNAVSLGRAELSRADEAIRREWLVTNGIGGFASGTLAGANSRCYHALLLAALRPPLGRTVLVAKVDEAVSYGAQDYPLSSSEYTDGRLAPEGYKHLESFELEGLIPSSSYSFADARLEKRIFMAQGENTTYLTYTLSRASEPLKLNLTPLCTYRDYHSEGFLGNTIRAKEIPGGVELDAGEGRRPYRLLLDKGSFEPQECWTEILHHRVEAFRGLPDEERLFQPGTFVVELKPGETVTLICTTERLAAHSANKALEQERERQRRLIADLPAITPVWIRQLVLVADQFIVQRGKGKSVIAGYPWFTDWGRDTMIALPGLALATGRPELAASILRTFAKHISQGMLPNRFPDEGEEPEYNTVDATLWYFVAIYRYFLFTGDNQLVKELYPKLLDIINWHERGTRYGICVDPADDLLYAGELDLQLSWMDVKVNDWVVTPRTGKPVEINALWHSALQIMSVFANTLKETVTAAQFDVKAERVAASFRRRFWYADGGYLYDVIDALELPHNDSSLRPNQLFALSLPFELLTTEQAKSVLDVCARELYTTQGLRSLSPKHPDYRGHYGGDRLTRDAAYHQGTVWAWLLGPFVSAHYRVYGDAALAWSYLTPLSHHLRDVGLGSISEIFDGDAPFEPRGCFAQAWSVAEVLRGWHELYQNDFVAP